MGESASLRAELAELRSRTSTLLPRFFAAVNSVNLCSFVAGTPSPVVQESRIGTAQQGSGRVLLASHGQCDTQMLG